MNGPSASIGGDLGLLLLIALFIAWLVLIVGAFTELGARRDLDGLTKLLWAAFIFFFPVMGLFVYYLVGRPETESTHSDPGFGDPTPVDLAILTDELDRAHDRLERGEITQAEFDAIKARIAGPESHHAGSADLS